MKICKRCACEFDGRRCKKCNAIASAKWRAENPERFSFLVTRWKSENKEATAKSRAARVAKNPEAEIARSAKYREENREKVNSSRAKRRADNPEKSRAINAAWRADNMDKVRASRKKYRLSHKEACRAGTARWEKKNPESKATREANRRARKNSSPGKLSRGLRAKLFILQKGKCACCRAPLGDSYHLDHIMPLYLGGENIDSNMQLLRSTCNQQKYTKHPVDFMRERGFLI